MDTTRTRKYVTFRVRRMDSVFAVPMATINNWRPCLLKSIVLNSDLYSSDLDDDGHFLLDSDPEVFNAILTILRDDVQSNCEQLVLEHKIDSLKRDLQYYCIITQTDKEKVKLAHEMKACYGFKLDKVTDRIRWECTGFEFRNNSFWLCEHSPAYKWLRSNSTKVEGYINWRDNAKPPCCLMGEEIKNNVIHLMKVAANDLE